MAVESPSYSAESMQRIRRLLRVLRIIAAHTAMDRRPSNDSAAHLTGRIGAIGRAALAGAWGVDLECLVRDELCLHAAREGIDIQGPSLLLNADSAPFIGLAVHELTTNAVKFGALSPAGGRLSVTWGVEGVSEAARFVFDWHEDGVQMPESGGRVHGFGTEVLQRVIAAELRGDGKMLFLGTGVRCTIAIPTREALLLNE